MTGRFSALVLCLSLALTCGVSGAFAQVALDQFRPAPLPSDGFALSRPEVLKNLDWAMMVVGDYANNPLVIKAHPNTPQERTLKLVDKDLVLHVGFAVGLGDRFTLFGSLPIHVLMTGQNPGVLTSKADGAGIGDFTLGGRIRLVGDSEQVFALSAELIARLPTADLANSDQAYSGDKIGTYEPALVGELHFGRFDIRARAGARFRKKTTVGDLTFGQDLVYGVGARLRVVSKLYLHAEFYGSSNFSGFSDSRRTPLELLIGPKAQLGNWFLGAAAGPGFTDAYGTPDFRVVANIGYASTQKPPPPAPPRDTDGDGIPDGRDRCPRDAEDKDNFEDDDGCPDPDNDRDGVADAADRCPSEAEDTDAFQDEDGCPDPDNDQDGTLDGNDACPLDPEDKDGFEDTDGCPELDNDKDGIPDAEDKCPNEAGVASEKGCPAVAVDVAKGIIKINERVEFESGKDVILSSSDAILNAVSDVLTKNPELRRVRIEGHTDDVGQDKHNLKLSTARALSVSRWFMQHGIAAERLEAWGCGEARPIAEGTTPEARQANRRVEFHIVDPVPAEPRSTEGCTQVPVK